MYYYFAPYEQGFHEWLHVRSLYFPDPERCPEPVEGGNLLGFVYYDESVR